MIKLLLIVVLFVLSLTIRAQNDSVYFKLPVEKKIQIVSANNHKICWAIAGNDSSTIYKIDSNLIVTDKTKEFRNFTKSKFTSVLTIHDSAVIVGTQNDFLYFYNRNKINKIEKTRGIADSSILSISYSKSADRIYVETFQNGYASIDSTYSHYLCFTSLTEDNSYHDSIINQLNSGSFLKYVMLPVKTIAKPLVAMIVNKDTTSTKKERKIKRKQIIEIRKQLQPGDILFKREDDVFQNSVISGYWTHCGIFIGNLVFLNRYFKGLPMLHGMKPSKYILKHYPKIYLRIFKYNFPIIESVTKTGVVISPLKNIAYVDHFAVLRPKLSREDKFLAILKSFEYYKLPYGFDFDFSGKNAVVCSELVYKSYMPTKIKKGINFKLGSMFGCPFVYPGDIVRKFDEEYENPNAELEFILFYDSNKEQKNAFQSSKSEFRKTYLNK